VSLGCHAALPAASGVTQVLEALRPPWERGVQGGGDAARAAVVGRAGGGAGNEQKLQQEFWLKDSRQLLGLVRWWLESGLAVLATAGASSVCPSPSPAVSPVPSRRS